MEREAFFCGYCRQLDSSRTVAVEAEGGCLTEVDCCFETCIYAPNCPIGQSIRDFLQG